MTFKWKTLILAAALALSVASPAGAVLNALGPIDPINGFPQWYQDANGRALQLCLDGVPGVGLCAFAPVDPTSPFSVQIGFGAEAFYMLCSAKGNIRLPGGTGAGGKWTILIAQEASFIPTIANGNQQAFSRVRVTSDAPVAGTYTVTHPYGVETITVTTPGVRAMLFTRDVIGAPPAFLNSLNGDVGPFIQALNPPPPLGYIGDATILQTITGSPFGTNFVRIDGPAGSNLDGLGNDFIQLAQFTVAGKIFTGVVPTPLTVDRTTYARTALGDGQVDVFANSLPQAVVTVADTSLVPLFPPTTLAGNGAGNFFAHIPLLNATALPATVSVTADASVALPGNQPFTRVSNLIDTVETTKAEYNATTNSLVVNALSSDALLPPTLTVAGFGPLVAGAGTFTTVAAPPAFVTTSSSKGGAENEDITVIGAGGAGVILPQANNDAFTTANATPKLMNVLLNDVIPVGRTLSSVNIVSPPLHGTLTGTGGAITYTPTGTFAGTDSFTYTITDSTLAVSNVATVTLTVAGLNVAPVANNDTATAASGVTTTINVLANDIDIDGTIDPTTVALVSLPLHGVASVNAVTGAVGYTATAGFSGFDSFTYTVKDNLGAVSNAATVGVTVVGAPVAVNDSAGANQGFSTVISVLANDTAPGSTLNAATVLVVTPPVNATAVANANGTVTFLAQKSGTYTFTYNVKNAFGIVSNTATVTVIVAQLKIGSAKYLVSTSTWQIAGNCITPGVTITAHAGPTLAGATIGSTTVSLAGTWTINVPASPVPSSTTVSVVTSQGVSVLAFPVVVK